MSCAHDHDCGESDCAAHYSLHRHVNLAQVQCLNEAEEGSAQRVFRPWDERLNLLSSPLCSNEDVDEQLLLHVPFDGQVKLQAICIIGGGDGQSPARLKAFVNRDDLDFGMAAELPASQEWELAENPRGEIEYPTRIARFNGVHSIDLYIPENFGASQTSIHFIGFKGEFTQRKRQAVIAVYESQAMPEDHKVGGSFAPGAQESV